MSSCFFSSREKMRISFKSESKKCFKTVEPKEPVPPVIIRVALSNVDIFFLLFYKTIMLITLKNIACINLILHIIQTLVIAVCDDSVAHFLELSQIIDHKATNSLTASASVKPINSVSMFSLIAPSCSRPANSCAAFTNRSSLKSVPTMIREG